MKKLLTITVLMVLAMSGMAQILNYDFSAECETGQTLYYRISSEEEHTVTLTFPYSTENPWFEGNYYQYHVMPQGELILPSTVTNNGINYYVTVIDNYAFCNCEELTGTLAIPEGIVSIGESAFFSCGFSSFVIPRTINFIDPSAFRFCSNRDSVIVDDNNPTYYSENNAIIKRNENTLVLACNTTTIPEYIENIGDYAFSGVGNGGDLIIPNSVKSIGERAFESCHFLGSLILSESLETIGHEAFRGSGLTGSLTIPNSVTELGAGAFLDVSFTGTLTLPSSISNIKGHTFAYTNFSGTLTIPNSVTQIGSRAFYGADFSELVLGSSVDTIGFGAFEDCSSLSGTLHLPSSINSIGIDAFSHTSFSELYSHNIVPPTLFNSSTFEGYDTNTPIHIPFGCTEAYQNASGWNYFTNFIEEAPSPTPIVPDLYTIGYKDNNSATRTAKLYKNNALLHSIRVTGKQITPYKIANDSEGNIYWLVVYSVNSSTLQTEIWKNDELYLSTEGHNGVTIKDLYCLGDTLFYVGNTTTEEGITVATVWRGPDFTPHWVLGDGQHDSFIYDVDVDKNTNIPYFCGYITDSLMKASVWEASQLLYKQEPLGSQRASWANEISIDNGSVFTNGYLNYDTGFGTVSNPTIWKDNVRILNGSEPEFINCLYANQDDFYYTLYYPHGMYYGVLMNNGDELLQLPFQSIQRIYGGFDDIYMVGKSDNKGSIWKNFELLSQREDCDVIMDILAVEATDVDTTFTFDNTEWYYEILNDDGSITYQHLECVGDTLIGREGKRPKVIVRSNTHYDRNEITEVTHEYVYEENGMVYWWNKDLQEFTTLYNLNANAGDAWEIKVGTESLTMHVDAVENIEYEGQTYRMLHVSDSADVFSGNILCNIGHQTSFFPERLMTRDRGYRVEGIRCYWVDGELMYKTGEEDCDAIYAELHNGIEEDGPSTGSGTAGTLLVYPNPANDILFVETRRATSLPAETEYRITNLMGQTLLQGHITAEKQQINIDNLPAGLYFITIAGETQKFVIE